MTLRRRASRNGGPLLAVAVLLVASGCGKGTPAAPGPAAPRPPLVIDGEKASKWVNQVCDADAGLAKDASDRLVAAGPAAIPELIGGFNYVKPYSGWEAVALTLVRFGDRVISPACEGLKSADGPVRYGCARVLQEFGTKAAPGVPALRNMLKDPLALYRISGANTLRTIGPASAAAVPELIALLKDPEANARLGAVQALAYIGPGARAAVPALLEARNDSLLHDDAGGALLAIDPDALKSK